MKFTEFQKMKIIEKESEMDSLDVDEFFLYGKSVINQQQNKQAGQPISYYQVLETNEFGTVSYVAVFDTLEDD
jgi:hypothetical protein